MNAQAVLVPVQSAGPSNPVRAQSPPPCDERCTPIGDYCRRCGCRFVGEVCPYCGQRICTSCGDR